MADVSVRQIDIADQSVVDQLYKDIGNSQHAQAVVLVNSGGGVSGGRSFARPTVTVDTAAYVAGDCIGGIISLTSFVDVTGGKAEIDSITITELGGQAPPVTITFYKATPTGGTYTDNAALAIDATDVADRVGTPIKFVAGDFDTVGASGHRVAGLTFQPMGVECAATTLFMVIEADGPYDAVAATDFLICIGYRKL